MSYKGVHIISIFLFSTRVLKWLSRCEKPNFFINLTSSSSSHPKHSKEQGDHGEGED